MEVNKNHDCGKDCFILPDNDEAGQNYAVKVAEILSKLDPTARVRIANLPELQPKGDVSDFIGIDVNSECSQLIKGTMSGANLPCFGNVPASEKSPNGDNDIKQPNDELLTIKDVANLIKSSIRNVYRLADSNSIPKPIKFGGSTRWRRSDLMTWISMGCPKTK